jgi:hypothetical protein
MKLRYLVLLHCVSNIKFFVQFWHVNKLHINQHSNTEHCSFRATQVVYTCKWFTSLIKLMFYYWDGVRLCLCGAGPLTDTLSMPQMIHEWKWSSRGVILTGEKRRTRRETSSSATFVHHKSHMDCPRLQAGPQQWKHTERLQWRYFCAEFNVTKNIFSYLVGYCWCRATKNFEM